MGSWGGAPSAASEASDRCSKSTCSSGSWDGDFSDKYFLNRPNAFRGVQKVLRMRGILDEELVDVMGLGEDRCSDKSSGVGGKRERGSGATSLNRRGS